MKTNSLHYVRRCLSYTAAIAATNVLAPNPGIAGTIAHWTDWSSFDATQASGQVNGIGITYTGPVLTTQTQINNSFGWNTVISNYTGK